VAIQVLTKYGGPAQFGVLEQLLDDGTPLAKSRNGPSTVTQIRDLALAGLIHLHQQDVREFGFPAARQTSLHFFDPASLGFPNDQQRLMARQKWQDYLEGVGNTEVGSRE
jgi:hypothetical protein